MNTRLEIPIIVNHSRRFDNAHKHIADQIKRNDFGDLVQGHIYYYGGWQHMGVHIVDTLLYFFKKNINIIHAAYRCDSKYPQDPTLDVALKIDDAEVQINGFPESFYQILEFNLLFEKGQIKINDFGKDIVVSKKILNRENESVLMKDSQSLKMCMNNPIYNAVNLIIKYLDTNDTTLLSDVNIFAAEKTMKLIWKGVKKYNDQLERLTTCH